MRNVHVAYVQPRAHVKTSHHQSSSCLSLPRNTGNGRTLPLLVGRIRECICELRRRRDYKTAVAGLLAPLSTSVQPSADMDPEV